MINGFTFLGIAGLTGLIIAIVVLLVLIFEIAMFISVVKNKRISDVAKVLWILGMLLIHPFVAIAYYFSDHQRSK